ncbi:MAG: c-type cytochrome domain-containing protein [Chitinophagaceae bacterium]
MIDFIGRLHPLLVHLPIGMLMIGLLLFWRSKWRGVSADKATAFVFLMASVTAMLSCVSGYLLSTSNDEYGTLVIDHRNAAIMLTVVSGIFWWLLVRQVQPLLQLILSVIVLALLVVTGHQGGTLTHGESFLWGNEKTADAEIPVINDLDHALVYKDIIAPILSQKCVSCHGPNKQKGKLRLDGQEWILKGGKSGATIVAGNNDASEIIKHIVLPPDDEDHMPPKEKGQLTTQQVKLIQWWVQKGASFSASVQELAPDADIQQALNALMQKAGTELAVSAALPEVGAAPDSAITILKSKGVIVIPIAQGSNLLNVNFINCTAVSDTVLTALKAIAPQLYWLKAEGPFVKDELVEAIGGAKHLKRLSLAGSGITSKSKQVLKQLNQLEQVNLYQTPIEEKKKTDTTKRS